ncbi:MAG TPA: aldo/keto reductase [Candidatus Handelsmanbacteria bacterium]|nr:aldo/keto reductase [Candidatus Handelsmanbacteria bacterium]
MEKLAQLGTTDLEISRHGFGAARIGDGVSLDQIENLLDSLLDLGITFIDTADCYTRSEELIGRYLGDRSGEFVIATKCGCTSGGDGEEEYSRAVIEKSIDRSLKRMGLECLDLVFLHTCSAEVLRAGEAADALMRARDAGKVRYTGYSGDDADALQAISMGVFDAIQVTFNILNQTALDEVLPAAQCAGIGVVAKRPIANARLLPPDSPQFHGGPYWNPVRSLLTDEGAWDDPLECSLRFTLSHPVITSAIIGTTNALHARENANRARGEALSPKLLDALHKLHPED